MQTQQKPNGHSGRVRLFWPPCVPCRFWYSRDEDDPERSGAEGIPHLQNVRGQSHRPHLLSGQRHAAGQGGTPPPHRTVVLLNPGSGVLKITCNRFLFFTIILNVLRLETPSLHTLYVCEDSQSSREAKRFIKHVKEAKTQPMDTFFSDRN